MKCHDAKKMLADLHKIQSYIPSKEDRIFLEDLELQVCCSKSDLTKHQAENLRAIFEFASEEQ